MAELMELMLDLWALELVCFLNLLVSNDGP